MTEIVTYTGLRVQFEPTAPATIDPRDIAHHLALINRFNGATGLPYSVAQHSVHVMHMVERAGGTARQCLAALLHDAHEAYIGDITRPVKQMLGKAVGDLARWLDTTVCQRFGLPLNALWDPVIKAADDCMLATEWIDLGLKGPSPLPDTPRAPFAIKPWRWDIAEERFLAYLDTATARVGRAGQTPTDIIK